MFQISPVTMIAQSEDNKNHRKQSEPKTVCMETSINDIPFKTVRPLVVSMSLFGLLHLSGKNRWARFTKVYSTVVLLLMWAMFIRSFTLYSTEKFGPVLIFKIVFQSGTCLNVAAATTTYMICGRQNKLIQFLTRWSKLLNLNRCREEAFEGVNFKTYVRKANVKFYSCLTISWLAICVICSFIGYCFFVTDLFDYTLSPMDPNHHHAFLLKCILYMMFIYMFAGWVFTLCLFCYMGFVIYEEFRIFHEDFEKAVQPNGDLVGIGHYCKRHQEICLLVQNADNILSGFSAVGIAVCTLQGMMILYNVLWNTDHFKNFMILMTNIYWFQSALVGLVCITVGGGFVNHMAHSPIKTIHNIQLKTISTEISLQMNMFIAKLAGEPIGLTAMGMFVIDKPTILTISGAFLTYFIVLIQFQQSSDEMNVFPNCTSIGQ